MVRRLVLLLAACLAAMAAPALARDRVALVIGNSAYTYAEPLANATADARDIAAMLKSLGFEVYEGYDLTQRETLELAARMSRRLSADDIALAYYAGHGVQIGTQNYLMPVDAIGQTQEQLKDTSVSLRAILAEIELRAEVNIVLLDACRNNPFEAELASRSAGGASRGLARVDASIGAFIAFATQPGNVALDGEGRNSPFATALLKHMPSESDDLHEVMRKVRKDVIEATDSFQVPWENSSLIDKVYLAQRTAPVAAPPLEAPAPVVTLAPAPAPVPAPQPAPDPGFTHVVQGLDPNGDGFLALRAGTTGNAPRLAKMGEGTRLRFLGQEGAWMHVTTETGLTGWAHTNWIAPLLAAPRQAVAPAQAAVTCDTLWYERNAIFARRGYCFQSARGQAAFGNAGCTPGLPADQVPLTAEERGLASALLSREQAMGCR
jgi:hypothetical protein